MILPLFFRPLGALTIKHRINFWEEVSGQEIKVIHSIAFLLVLKQTYKEK